MKYFFEKIRNTFLVMWADLLLLPIDLSYEYEYSFFKKTGKSCVFEPPLGDLVINKEILPLVGSTYTKQLMVKRLIIDNINTDSKWETFWLRQAAWHRYHDTGHLSFLPIQSHAWNMVAKT